MQIARWVGLIAMGMALAWGAPSGAQQCNDFDVCTSNDMCGDEGFCTGTPADGGACDDGDECTVNDRCDASFGGCTGDPAPSGTRCGGGCGTCEPLFPFPGAPVTCIGDPADDGTACEPAGVDPEFGRCLVGTCEVFSSFPGAPTTAFCLPAPKECPDAGNCRGACNPETGRCDNSLSRCFGNCERCDQGTCVPANQGGACDDFNPCSPQSSCGSFPIGNELRGFCQPGAPTGDTPTPTPTSVGATPTLPPTAPPTATRTSGPPPTLGACIGDCNGNGEIAINELITGVNIALGTASISTCASFDTNSTGTVEVNELIAGVNATLNGCVS